MDLTIKEAYFLCSLISDKNVVVSSGTLKTYQRMNELLREFHILC